MDPLSIFSAAKEGYSLLKGVKNYVVEWRRFRRPAGQVLGQMINNDVLLRIFVKDLIAPNNTSDSPTLFSVEGNAQMANPNIRKVWPDVEAKGVGELQNVLGQLGKRKKIDVVEMSEGYDMWDSDFIIFGAQGMKNREFYRIMDNVGYGADDFHIFDNQTKQPIETEPEYGYGLIIKAEKAGIDGRGKKHGILLGGFGILGTEAAIYYFCNAVHILGKDFGESCFSVVVRARIHSGVQSVERLKELDKVY